MISRASCYSSVPCRGALTRVAAAILIILFAVDEDARAAEPYLIAPPHIKDCKHPSVKIPEGAKSLFYPSDECGTIFVGPPSTIQTKVAAEFTSIPKAACDSISELIAQNSEIRKSRAELTRALISGSLKSADAAERKAQINLAQDIINEGLEDDYKIFGAKTAITITQDWLDNVRNYEKANPQYKVYPLPTVGGLISFDEKVNPDILDIYGLYDNTMKVPYLSYTVTGLAPLPTDSPLVSEGRLPIFFPLVRSDRANLKMIEFGGGAVTGQVTFNKAGYCQLASDPNQNPASFLVPTISFSMALKTFGSYTVEINREFATTVAEKLRTETRGTYFASALADYFFDHRSPTTINVILDNDLKNSLGGTSQQEALISSILTDAANQFLTVLTEGSRKEVKIPDVADPERNKTVHMSRKVCKRSGGLFGIGASTNCYDQGYDIRVLQDTTKFQSAVVRVRGAFSGAGQSIVRSYILVPWNASL